VVTKILRTVLNIVAFFNKIFGDKFFSSITRFVRKISFNKIPLWNKCLPKGAKSKFSLTKEVKNPNAVVYFPSCISRTMGNYSDSKYKDDQTTTMKRLLQKAGYKIIYPRKITSLCCGMPFSSKGFFEQGNKKAEELYNSLNEASNNGEFPILFDTSPCVKTFRDYLSKESLVNLRIYDTVEFVADKVLDKLRIFKKKETVAVHSTCSTTKMEITDKLLKIANSCAENVYVPEDINCCGFAGDRGFSFPELNESALENLDISLKRNNCRNGYSNSKTCEIGLSLHGGIEYNSIIYLVDECSEPKSNVIAN
jgi:D-lactate dehydrogenase